MPSPGDSPRIGDAGGREARPKERDRPLRVPGQDRDLLKLMRPQLVGWPPFGLGKLGLKREVGERRQDRFLAFSDYRQ